ncbi:coiled-coil-helix-coiled-coil-helix domain containing 3a isoform X2 [Brachyhypopomus gauderio]|uniref:coiled-coil-helix-coiled-coil-helix domain containing 3a isoform X2 n=1 Tax=Brachyhypopomus gauderio TaxID=698409 RepID=UPI004042937B
MGGGSSTRRVSFESDENDNVTVVKGIRLSENVINRMREASGPQQTPSTPTPPPPPLLPVPPPFNPIISPTPQPAPEHVGSSAPPPVEPATPIKPSPAGPVALPLKVDEADLRRKIAEEVQRGLEKESSKRRQELHQWLEKERSHLQAEAHADTHEDKVSRILASERAAAEDGIHYAALRQRITRENERARAQSKQLEERQQALRKQEAFYREQVAKLEERSVQFYKVTSENYHKAADEVNAKFKRYEVSPVCAELQDQIVRCYRENEGRSLLCSSLASLYLQCVNTAKQKKLSTGG